MASAEHSRRKLLVGAGAAVVGVPVLGALVWRTKKDSTPEGAYLRVALAVSDGDMRKAFAYLEQRAQWACFSMVKAHRAALKLVKAHFPPERQGHWIPLLEPAAKCADGPDYFVLEARRQGWRARLAKDMTGVKRVEISGARASVETNKGTRYPFRRRPNGIWGLTIFSGHLEALSRKAARDLRQIEVACQDYARAKRLKHLAFTGARRL